MDASLALAGIIDSYTQAMVEQDFLGAEVLLNQGLTVCRLSTGSSEAFLHFYFGKLYREWNKLSSSLNHLQLAAELAHANSDHLLLIQIQQELKTVQDHRVQQRP